MKNGDQPVFPVGGEISKLPLLSIGHIQPPAALGAGGAVIEDGAMLPLNWSTTRRPVVQVFHLEDVAESFEVSAESLKKIGMGDVWREEG